MPGGAAISTGLTQSFVGTLMVAGAMSVPELVVMLAALRMRSIDMAIAGLLGSNIVNVAIIAVDDVAHRGGSIFSAAAPAHAGTGFGAVMMSATVVAAINDRPFTSVFRRLGWINVILTSIFAMTAQAIVAAA